MNCPSCKTTLTPGEARCLACGALVAPAMQGALAPKPEPLRELPGARKKEKTWREEVNERVRSRRKKHDKGAEPGLPLFDGLAPGPAPVALPSSPPTELDQTEFADAVDQPLGDLPLRPTAAAAVERFHDAPARSRFEKAEEASPAVETARSTVELGEDEPARTDDEWPLELQPEAAESIRTRTPGIPTSPIP